MKVKSESEVTESHPTLSDPVDYSLPGSSVHGIFQARVLEWGAIEISNRFPGMLVLSSTEHDLVHPGLVFIEETGAQRSQQVAQSHTACKWQSEDV